mmetsp:Transcript_24565/g.79331  ORF Transcript_24565/g.79331 Transcript_24565/m.79331 type:complete len:131 (+) Transcript_24565:544-936(+)
MNGLLAQHTGRAEHSAHAVAGDRRGLCPVAATAGALEAFVRNRECAAAALVPLSDGDGRQRAARCFGDGLPDRPLRNGLGERRVASALEMIRGQSPWGGATAGSWGPGRVLGGANALEGGRSVDSRDVSG